MTDSTKLLQQLRAGLADFDPDPKRESWGTVTEVGDGIARITGLRGVGALEMLEFEDGQNGVALNLEKYIVGAIILGRQEKIKAGQRVKALGKTLSVPVGEEFLGRVTNALLEAKDGKGAIAAQMQYPMEKVAPGVITREPVNVPLQTGIKAIDALIPIGRGQRELIIGDRQTGKTAVAIDTILNQKGQDVICMYVSIGQKESKVRKIVAELEARGSLAYTVVVSASSSEPAALSFLAPYAGCALAEFFMDQGRDVLIVYDDLSKQAAAYREISLLLRRPPGREAYPGDVFYLHSRLLERSARRNLENGGGSITALPIIETQAGDISAYIPTNVISITDGQIYLESDLFYKGFRPAVNVGTSVSRVGSSAQRKAMKKVAGKTKLVLAQFRELESFAQFGSDLDEATFTQLEQGRRISEVLKQPQYQPASLPEQVVVIFAAVNGFLDSIPLAQVGKFETHLRTLLKTQGRNIYEAIAASGDLTPETERALREFIDVVKESF